jgi:hypothetical protein
MIVPIALPGVLTTTGKSHSSGKLLSACRIIPYTAARGSIFEFDAKDPCSAVSTVAVNSGNNVAVCAGLDQES